MARLQVAEDGFFCCLQLSSICLKDAIQVSSMEESVHRQDSLLMMLRAYVAPLYRLDNTTATQSFSLGIVNYLR